MKTRLLRIVAMTSVITFFAISSASALITTPMDSADNLAQLLVGSGVTISNVSYTGSTTASGYFTDGTSSGLGFDSGIVLTSGSVSNINGSTNTSDSITTNNNLPGASSLDTLSGVTTYDATALSFDFTSAGDSVFFNYAFGSDEYNEYVDKGVNDTFAFFFDGINIATLPDGTPVSVDTINSGDNASFFNNNDPSDTTSPFAFEYDGFTDVLTAQIMDLVIGETYSLSLMIADGGDYILDSGVFLQAGSFSDTIVDPGDGTAPVPEPSTILLLGSGLVGLAFYTRRRKKE